MERYGTSYFRSLVVAEMYYRDYGFDAADVQRKLDDGEIHLGMPPAREGWIVAEDDDGRYWMEQPPYSGKLEGREIYGESGNYFVRGKDGQFKRARRANEIESHGWGETPWPE